MSTENGNQIRKTHFTNEMIQEYVGKGFWTEDLTVDFWDRNAPICPEREAIVDAKTRLTWATAKKCIDSLALHLLDLGLRKDEVLLAQIFNCVELHLIRLACEKAKILLALVPYTFRHNELQAVLKQVKARGIVIPYSFRGFNYYQMYQDLRQDAPFEHVILIHDQAPKGATLFKEMLEYNSKREDLETSFGQARFEAFGFEEIMTTSGSTGLPKCVEWAGCSRLAHGRETIQRFNLTANDVIFPFYASIAGSAELLSYRAAPQIRAKTVLLDHFDPNAACSLIEREKVTVGITVPALVVRLLSYPQLSKHDLGSLRLLVCTAAHLPYSVAMEAEKRLGCSVVQCYGTMDSGGISMHSLDDPPEARFLTVGKPLTGNDIRFINQDGNEVPAGSIGSITVNGPYATSGYYGDPDATRKAWRGGRFDLGDLGMLDEEGRIKLVGRVKDMIIRGGQNIYPSEIESLLVRHPKVLEAAVVKMPDVVMGEKACACVVQAQDQTITFDEIVSFLKERKIAPFKLPERLEVFPSLPLVPGGNKVDKRSLEQTIAGKLKAEGKIQ